MNNPKEIDEVFDKISYKKGASLIRMLHSLMGEEDFKQGIRSTGFRNVKSRGGNATPLPALGSVRLCDALQTDLPDSPSLPHSAS